MEVLDQTIEELREEALDLGIEHHPNLGAEKLKLLIDTRLEEIANAQKAKKEAKEKSASQPKVRIVVEHREGDDYKVQDQFFGRVSMETGDKENILIQFGEEVEVSEKMFEHIKSKGGYIKKFKMVTDEQTGEQKKEWYDKWKSRFIVSKV